MLSQAGLPKVERPHRPSRIDPYLPFVLKTLEQYPRLTASRLCAAWYASAAIAAGRITSAI